MQFIKIFSLFFVGALFVFVQATFAQKIAVADKKLPNFGQIDSRLYRGGQPTEAGFERLARMGVKTIIDLRGEDENARVEQSIARKNGMNFVNVNLSNWRKPQTMDIERIIKIMDEAKNQPVFIHCKRGADRTGTVVAVYRISHDNWTAAQAITEAKNYKIGWWQFLMKDYINDFYRDFKNKLAENNFYGKLGKI